MTMRTKRKGRTSVQGDGEIKGQEESKGKHQCVYDHFLQVCIVFARGWVIENVLKRTAQIFGLIYTIVLSICMGYSSLVTPQEKKETIEKNMGGGKKAHNISHNTYIKNMRLNCGFHLLAAKHLSRGVDSIPTTIMLFMLLALIGDQFGDGVLIKVWVFTDFLHKFFDDFLVHVAGTEISQLVIWYGNTNKCIYISFWI